MKILAEADGPFPWKVWVRGEGEWKEFGAYRTEHSAQRFAVGLPMTWETQVSKIRPEE